MITEDAIEQRIEGRQPIDAETRAEILARFKKYRAQGIAKTEAYRRLGEQFHRDWKVIGAVIQRLLPTTDLAVATIKARAFKMAKRLVREADPSQIMDILSRPNIGVLDPIKKVDGGAGGFIIGVSVESCGAVRVGVSHGLPQPTRESVPVDAHPDQESPEEAWSESPRDAGTLEITDGGAAAGQQAVGLCHVDEDPQHPPTAAVVRSKPGQSKAFQTAVVKAQARGAKAAGLHKKYLRRTKTKTRPKHTGA